MNTNQNESKQVIIQGFSIGGIDGFQTVAAQGSSAEKRMGSAINHMDRELSAVIESMEEDRARCEDSAKSTIETAMSSVKLAQEVITIVKGRWTTSPKVPPEVVSPTNQIAVVSTKEFFERSSGIFANNAAHLIENAKAINDNLKNYISERKDKDVVKYDSTPNLFLCSGAFFKEGPFPLVISGETVKELGGDDFTKAIREFCARSVRSNKNLKLTDYLRTADDDRREKIRSEILRLDEYLSQIEDVHVQSLGALVSIPAPGKSREIQRETFKRATPSLEFESQERLAIYTMSMAKLENKLDADVRHAADSAAALLRVLDDSDEVSKFVIDPTNPIKDNYSGHPWFELPYLCWKDNPNTDDKTSEELDILIVNIVGIIREELQKKSRNYFISLMADNGYPNTPLCEPVGADRPGMLVFKVHFLGAVHAKRGLFGV